MNVASAMSFVWDTKPDFPSTSSSTWQPLENQVLKTRFITKQQHQQKKKSEQKGKKKDEDKEMNPEKIRPPRPREPGGPGHASPTTWAARAPSCQPKSRKPGSRGLGGLAQALSLSL